VRNRYVEKLFPWREQARVDAACSPSMEGFKTQPDQALRGFCLAQRAGVETSKGVFLPKSLCDLMKPGFICNYVHEAAHSAQ